MSTNGIEVFGTTIQVAHRWLKVVMSELGTNNRHEALAALRASLHALRDRIGPENAVHFGAQLPMLLRGLYYEGWKPTATPTRERHLGDFLDRVQSMLERSHVDATDALCASFDAVAEMMPPDEVLKVINLLPQELRVLWPMWLLEGSEIESKPRP